MSDVLPATAEGFARDTGAYVRGRPDFPRAALGWLREDLGLDRGKTAIDLGAGTGKFTRLMVQTHADILAIEPSRPMLDRLTEGLPGINALRGSAQAIPLALASADAVVCAQAFHWFATREALAEIRRVLRPGGYLGLIWNVRDSSVPWVRALTAIMAPHEGDAPRHDHGEWRQVFPAEGFEPLRQRSCPHVHVGPPEQVIVDRVASVSFIAALPEQTRAGVLAQVRALIADTPELAGRASVEFPYVTHAYWCRAR
jgi:SAM-dependent methyltransferase